MRFEARMLVGIALFLVVVGVGYWFWSGEAAGTVMLLFGALMGLTPGLYYMWWSRRMAPRPEDREDATIADGAGTIGAFPDNSLWPFILGLGAALIALGLIFGIWTALPGSAVVLSAAVGYTAESRRGGRV